MPISVRHESVAPAKATMFQAYPSQRSRLEEANTIYERVLGATAIDDTFG